VLLNVSAVVELLKTGVVCYLFGTIFCSNPFKSFFGNVQCSLTTHLWGQPMAGTMHYHPTPANSFYLLKTFILSMVPSWRVVARTEPVDPNPNPDATPGPVAAAPDPNANNNDNNDNNANDNNNANE